MYNNWAKDKEVTKFLSWPAHENLKMTEEYISFLTDNYKKSDSYDWAIELKEIGEVIGSIGVVYYKEEIQSMHIGYCIGRKWWHKGITSESLSAVIKYLMEDVKVNRIESRHDIMNENSGKVMMKCGLKYEGTLRQSDINNSGICDTAWYGLLKEDYFL